MRTPDLDPYFEQAKASWQLPLLQVFRQLALDCGLTETKKWGAPVYVHQGNVVSISTFKNHLSIWFFEGVHLLDPAHVLSATGEKTKALRQWRFVEGDCMDLDLVRQYVMEAMANDAQGVKTAPERSKKTIIPSELAALLDADPVAKAAFERMPPSHRREHADHVAEAKREETRQRRAEKCLKMILGGEGLHDRYR